MAGLHLDPWEILVLDQMLSERDKLYYNDVLNRQMRTYSAYEVGLVLPRQNGKGSCLEARELAGLFLLGERVILHSAHEFATAREGFQRIEALISDTPELKKEVARGGIKWSHGDESITLKSGQRLLFKTRTKGAARGFTVDTLIFDEAMILDSDQASAMMFTTSARPNSQVIYAGSAGLKLSTHLARVRARGLSKDDPRLAYMEWSVNACTDMCPINCQEHDRTKIVDPYRMSDEELERAEAELVASIAKANPGLGIRLSLERIESERRSMDAESFARERLGVGDWPSEEDAWAVISEEAWRSRVDETSIIPDKNGYVLAIDSTPNRTYSCIAVCGLNEDGKHHVEITGDAVEQIDHRPGVAWVVDRVLEIRDGRKPLAVIIDKGSPASCFIDRLEKEGVEITSPNTREYAQGCGDFYSAVIPRKGNEPTLVHLDQGPLTVAVAGACQQDSADMWKWSRKNSTAVDISPLVASTLALWGLKKVTYKKRSEPWVFRQ